ncbi:MAG: right-handed parallel beta-helix repeat-containing protein, partial [Planctomycetota bacterium]
GHDYYVNIPDDPDAGLPGADNEYTTASGDNTNSGADPDHPMASLQAVLAAYDLDYGDTIWIDTGEYSLDTTVEIIAQDAGVTIRGPEGPDHSAVLDRNNRNWSAVNVRGAPDVTIMHVGLTGGNRGLWVGETSPRVTVDHVTAYDNKQSGVYIASDSPDATVRDSTFYGTTGNDNTDQNRGVEVYASDATVEGNTAYHTPGSQGEGFYIRDVATATVTGNEAYSNVTGVWIRGSQFTASGNTVHDNTTGMYTDDNGSAVYSEVFDNEAYNNTTGIDTDGYDDVHDNHVHDNSGTGIETGYADWRRIYDNTIHHNERGVNLQRGSVSHNRIYANTNYGVVIEYKSGTVQNNHIYGNSTGIYDGHTENAAYIRNNLVYDNENYGIYLTVTGTYAGPTYVYNNTVHQNVGTGVYMNNRHPTDLMNNIIWINGGFGIDVTTDATGHLTSDYNDIHRGIVPDGKVGRWAGAEAADLDDGTGADWKSVSGQDAHSLSVDPGFIDIDGADNVFGWVALETKDGGVDDNFHVGGGSPIIDAAYSDVATLTDRDGLPRHNDLGMPDTGGGIFGFYDIGCYEFQSSTNDVTKPTVELVLPLPPDGETMTAAFTEIIITFSEAMEFTAANSPDNYELIGSGGDGRFDDGGEVAVELTPAYAFGDLDVTLTWGGAPLPSDLYRLTLFSTETAFLADVAGNKLDGNENGPDSDSYIRTFGVDYDPPVVDHIVPSGAVPAGPSTIEVVFDEANAMADATVEDKTNYTLIDSGGDDDLENGGTDISAQIDSVSYNAATRTATLNLTGALPAERYRLTVGAGITDAQGRPLNGGTDQSFDFLVDGIAPVGELVAPAPGSVTDADLGYVDVRWDDGDGVGINPATVGIDDITIPGVSIDDVVDLGGSVWRYAYDLDADALAPGVVTVSFVAGAVQDEATNASLGGSDQFTYDVTGPEVTAVTPVLTGGELVAILVDFNERLSPATAEDTTNYRLVASGGDAAFDDGTDVNLSGHVITAAYDDGLLRVTLTIDPALPDEAYQLTVVGTTSVEDLAGNPLNDGDDEVRSFVVNETVATMTAALHPDDDTGVSGDGVTHETDLDFEVTVNEAGKIAVDYDDDTIVDEEVLATGPGTYSLTGAAAFGEGLYTVRVDFTDTAGGTLHEDVGVEVDLTGPQVTDVSAVPSEITITFDDALEPASAGDPGNYQLISAGPNGELDGVDDVTVPVTPAYTPGGTTVTLTRGGGDFDEGLYELTVYGTTSVTDAAGNRLSDGASDHVEEIVVTSEVPPVVVGTDPARDEMVLSLPACIEVTFSKPIDELSVGVGDLVFGGSAVVRTEIDSVTKVNDMTWQYNICGACGTDWTTGVVEVTLPAGAVTDGGSRPVEEHSWSFLYDPTAPQAALA